MFRDMDGRRSQILLPYRLREDVPIDADPMRGECKREKHCDRESTRGAHYAVREHQDQRRQYEDHVLVHEQRFQLRHRENDDDWPGEGSHT